VGPINKVVPTFDHLLTLLALVGLKVKVSKYKLWSSSKISSGVEIPQGYTLVINGLRILGVPMGFQNFVTHFLNEALFQDMVHIDDLPLLGNTHVGILSLCATHQPFFLTQIVPPSFLFLLANCNK
jgi:hypothetical protein